MTKDTDQPQKDAPELRAPAQPRLFTSEELFAGHGEIVVLHRGSPYRLRITRQDKLILTK